MKLSKTSYYMPFIVVAVFSTLLFAATPVQLDSLDDISAGGTNWVETTGNYMVQESNDANFYNEGTGSMKFDFTSYTWPNYDDDVIRTFNPVLDFTNYRDLAITLWVWTNDPADSRRLSLSSRLREITLHDGSAFNRIGRFTPLPLKNVGWNKVIAPLKNFAWKAGTTVIDPNEVDWNDITKIGMWARTEDGTPTSIYIDDIQLEWLSEPNKPYQIASCDDIVDDQWEETHGTTLMVQAPPGEVNEGTGSIMIDFSTAGANWDLTPTIRFVPALDLTDGDWAFSVWVWSDLVLDSYLWELSVRDIAGDVGRCRIRRADINNGYGWNKITVRVDELLWANEGANDNFPDEMASDAHLDTIVSLELWTMYYPHGGNNIYLDDLQIESAVTAPSDAVVYNADYGTITVDGNPADWASLVDSDPIDFDLAAINFTAPAWAPASPPEAPWPHTGSGDMHVKYRLAWDPNYLYILVEEQSGDNLAYEATSVASLMMGGFDDMGTYYDALALAFDFTNNRLPGLNVQMGLWLFLGLSSTGQTDLWGAMLNTLRGTHNDAALADGSVATGGTLGNRVIEAKLKWSVLGTAIDPWFLPAGGIEAAVKPGFMFGCDPRLLDMDDTDAPYTATHAMGWLSGVDDPIGWPQGYYRYPTGRDSYSTDIRLVCSAGDLDFDCDVDFVDYAQFAKEWFETGCNNVNDFCNGADVLTPMDGEVGLTDLARFAMRWLD